MTTVKVGVIGVGALGRHHARLYTQCDDVELVGVYDQNTERAREVAEEVGGVSVYETPELLADAVEGVSIAVPTDLHFDVVKGMLGRHKHVLVEKPITETVVQAEELVRLAAASGLVLGVGHVERYNPVLECLDKTPGEPRFIEAHRLAAYPPPRPGLRPRGTEVSVVLDLMIHDIDILLSLVKSEVKRVDAVGVPVLSETEDIANARLVFANQCVANLTASRVSAESLRKLRVFKSDAYLSLDYQDHCGEIAYKGDHGIIRESVPVHDCNALKVELEDFCRCIGEVKAGARRSEPRVTGRHGLEALRVADRIAASIKENDLSD
ncbi:MAG: Gfo/Idh/MocA family oxidoreductase [Candidatus Pacebacteria bacterium]|nr:Gfo/Idh/MocA family oxidoreductase [Candidatus Paceibacterota bacterium]